MISELSHQKKISACEYCDNPFPATGHSGHEGNLRKQGYSTIGLGSYEAPFEVFAQGLGLFLTRKNAWLGFNEHAKGFGGEECVIHEKYRQAERTTWCLPFLRWIHRFSRPRGVPYPLALEHRIHNYFIAFKELGLDVQPIIDHFKEIAPGANSQAILNDLEGFRDAFLVQQGLKESSKVAPLLPDFTNQKNFEGAVDLNIPLKLPG